MKQYKLVNTDLCTDRQTVAAIHCWIAANDKLRDNLLLIQSENKKLDNRNKALRETERLLVNAFHTIGMPNCSKKTNQHWAFDVASHQRIAASYRYTKTAAAKNIYNIVTRNLFLAIASLSLVILAIALLAGPAGIAFVFQTAFAVSLSSLAISNLMVWSFLGACFGLLNYFDPPFKLNTVTNNNLYNAMQSFSDSINIAVTTESTVDEINAAIVEAKAQNAEAKATVTEAFATTAVITALNAKLSCKAAKIAATQTQQQAIAAKLAAEAARAEADVARQRVTNRKPRRLMFELFNDDGRSVADRHVVAGMRPR